MIARVKRAKRYPARIVLFVSVSCAAATVAASPLAAAAPARSVPKALTGPYELYCPGTVLGSLVLHASAKASFAPSRPHPGQRFTMTGAQVQVHFPAGLAEGLKPFSPMEGTVTASLQLLGATPSAINFSKALSIVFPASVPAAGTSFVVPKTAATLGPFTATSNSLWAEMGSDVDMSLTVSFKEGTKSVPFPVKLDCQSFPVGAVSVSAQDPWDATSTPPASKAIDPVIAMAP